ncbi:hypothetical protein Echvi_3505 [Echinicola vietnamensis DSM 17526]|uniref:Uncharacterized protein n=1 Tax=Echinicola vietnamensis (strain DSM 17526 / LMG 23754 / KMM 6221) TaxID=926556 RepID=L0G3Y4_ECHVK|nr:hypothetical protein Echvi_3505 [Echinicola vietnamensis DSM 17526]
MDKAFALRHKTIPSDHWEWFFLGLSHISGRHYK